MLGRFSKRIAICLVGFVSPPMAYAQQPEPAPHWRTDPASCRTMMEALLANRITDATDAVVPDNATRRLRMNLRALMHHLAAGLAEGAAGRPATLQRVLPDVDLDGQPVAIESWYFGDQLFLAGCLVKPHGALATISVEVYPSTSEVLDHLRNRADNGQENTIQ